MIGYQIDRPRRVVLTTASGILSAGAIRDYQDRLRADPDFDPTFALIADFRAANLAEVTPSDIRRLAEEAPFGPESPRALVVSDDTNYGLARMFGAYSELAARKGPVEAFRDLESAWVWIEGARSGRL